MKARLAVLVAASAASLVPLLADGWAKAEGSAGTERQIRKLEEERRQAVLHNDTKALGQMYADGMTGIDIGGDFHTNSNKAAVTLNVPGTRTTKSWVSDEITVRAYGDTAVVTQRAHVEDVLRGTSRIFTARLTHVWVKFDGQWRLVARHATRIVEPQQDAGTATTFQPRTPFAAPAASDAAESLTSKAAEQVSQLNREFDEAEQRRDIAAIERTLADDFVWTTFGGTVFDRAQTRDHLKTSDAKYELFQSDQVRVRVYGRAAVVTARLTRRGKNSKRDLSGQFRYTRVFVNHNGAWQMAAYQVTQIADIASTASSPEAQYQEATVTLHGLRFHYLEWPNQTAPAMLLIPGTGGGGGCAQYWIPFASAMRDRYHIYAMEQRGQCDSEWAKEYTWQRVVEDIDAFVDKLHLAPVTIVGHSSGAVWGYLYAAQHPDKVSRLVAVDGGGAFNWPKTRAEAQQRAPLASRHVTFSSPEEAVTYAKTRWRTDPSVDPVVREWVLHGIRKLDDGRWGWRQDPAAEAATDQYIFLPTEDELNGAFPRIKCPTLIVRGSEGAVSRELANQVAHAIANGSWAEVANSGHVVPLANPSGFLAVVRQFLANSSNPALEQTPSTQKQVLKVVLLGTGGPTPRIERFGPSTLVEAGGRHFLFDCGRGAAQRLFQLGILREVNALFLTHLHSDHIVGIPDFWLSGWFAGRNTPLQIWGPAGTQDMIAHLQKAYAFDIQTRTGAPEHLPSSGVAVAAKDIAEGTIYNDGGVTIKAFNVDHGPVKPALGYRLDYAGHSVVISGDTRPSDNLVRFAKGTDVLIHNAVVLREREQISLRARSTVQLLATAQEAGSVFDLVKPRMAVYSHYNTADDLVAQTRQTYSGPLEVGEDLMAVEIGERIQVRRQSEKSAQALLEQQDRNSESEAEARRVIDAFNLANNRRDVEGLRNALNFPFVRIASGKVSVTRTREEFTIQDWPPGAVAEGWHHSAVDSVQFVQSSTEKVHAIVIFSRYKADGTRYATYRTLRIITKQDGHWGIQCSSSFAP